MQKSLMNYFINLEHLFLAIAVAAFYFLATNFAWYWLPITFFLYDFSLFMYIMHNKAGAWFYNATHSLIGPAVLTVFYVLFTRFDGPAEAAILFIILTWLFHIFVNRALGYGLKHRTDIEDTHTGKAKLHKKVAHKAKAHHAKKTTRKHTK